jgi:hypothetical protein
MPTEDETDRIAAQALGGPAKLQIAFADKMSEEGKVAIADWLREQAERLLSEGHNYADLYTARYNPEDDT